MADSQKKSANIITGQIDNSVIYTNGVVSPTNDYTTLYAPVTAGSEYSFAFTSSDVDSAYVYGFFTALPTMGSTTYNNSRTVKNYTQNPTITVTIPDTCTYIGIRIPNTALAQGKDVMLNAGSSVLPYEPHTSTGWLHSLRKLTTATEAVENPLYSDGTAITVYTLKGNEEHTGTPSPSNPVMPNGVGERTANLLNPDSKTTNESGAERFGDKFPAGTYYIINNTANNINWRDGVSSTQTHAISAGNSEIVTTSSDLVVWHFNREESIMVADSSVAVPFEPYGYKIPISNNQQTIDIYIGDLPLLKSLDGTAVDEISNGTLTRRVDADGSVLPTPITTQITMPSIPTTEGANSIIVDTTVQPSEFTATWTGWHNSSVQEYDGSDWQ